MNARRSAVLLVFLAAACEPQTKAPQPAAPAAGNATVAPQAAVTPAATTLAAVGLDPEALDRTVDPCTDFYQFSCGGWLAHAQIPADKSQWYRSFSVIEERNEKTLHEILEKAASPDGAADPISRQVGDYYAACMDEAAVNKAGLEALKPLMAEIARVHDEKSLAATLAALHRVQVDALFGVGSQQDQKDATRVIAALDQGGLGLPDRDYYLEQDKDSKELRAFYLEHLKRVFGLLGEKPARASAAAQDVMSIETQLAKMAQSRVDRRKPENTYHKIDLDGLLAASKTFPWKQYFQDLGHGDVKEINVTHVPYFSGLDQLAQTMKPAQMKHYLQWRLVDAYARALPQPFVDESFKMEQKLTGQAEIEPRWKRCVQSTDANLGELLGQRYVDAAFPGESKTIADAMVRGVSGSFRAEVASLPWMDSDTRAIALSKREKMNFKIGYPDKWRTYDFTVGRADYAANALASSEFAFHWDMKKIGKPVDRKAWGMTPATVNAYYDPSMNEMVFPAGILQSPFFDKNRPLAVNFGAVGMVMGHEFTHGFDDEGAKYDGDGNLKNWWTTGTGDQFKARTGCVINQYNNYEPLPGLKVNGELTTGENIADIGGLKLAFQAYHEARKTMGAPAPVIADGFNEDQQFFLSFAQSWCTKTLPDIQKMRIKVDPHSPAQFRVNGPVSDNPQFAEAFGCKVGTKMNPSDACSIW